MTTFRRKATRAAPRNPTRTEEQSAADALVRESQQRAAGRQAVRCLLIHGHGCTGRSCTSDRHGTDLDGLTAVLMCLGVIPDPLTDWKPGAYHVNRRRRAEVTP